ncbi:MAG: hypothetical protein HKL86_05590 [Acidimicrobiaceae bacterium]|nr:hypothetical protein [Acidimicrobiaceae bacterium]
MSASPLESSENGVERELREARAELELLRFRLHSVELAFYEHELKLAQAKRQLESPLYRVYAFTYRLLFRPIRPFAMKSYYFAKRVQRVVHRTLHR